MFDDDESDYYSICVDENRSLIFMRRNSCQWNFLKNLLVDRRRICVETWFHIGTNFYSFWSQYTPAVGGV